MGNARVVERAGAGNQTQDWRHSEHVCVHVFVCVDELAASV